MRTAPSHAWTLTANSCGDAIFLQIVESHRTGDQVRQWVIATLGWLDELEASGQLDRLLRSGARFVQQAMVLDATRAGDAPAVAVQRISPALLFERCGRRPATKASPQPWHAAAATASRWSARCFSPCCCTG